MKCRPVWAKPKTRGGCGNQKFVSLDGRRHRTGADDYIQTLSKITGWTNVSNCRQFFSRHTIAHHDALLNVSRQLIWLTIQSNSRPYSPLAMASRAAQASATVLFLVIVSPRVTTLFNVSASNISLGSTPRRRETVMHDNISSKRKTLTSTYSQIC